MRFSPDRRSAALCCGALCLSLLASAPARAEFPPEGATADPSNPATATGSLPDPKHAGTTIPYVFYFDCSKNLWIGVAVAAQTNKAGVAVNAVGPARQFPPGPPPGAKLDPHNPNRAIANARSFVLRDGNWYDGKTGAIVKSPKLCAPEAAPAKPAAPPTPPPDDKAPPAPQPVSPASNPNNLPPPPSVNPR
ncbi:MAG TPA: hypothetical protein VMJ73_16765 [Rhizomicrobium sp.]|nr:hypothetical protein [Rhizomicrobium sp.]